MSKHNSKANTPGKDLKKNKKERKNLNLVSSEEQ